MPEAPFVKSSVKAGVAIVLITALLAVCLEGLASFILFATDMDLVRIPAERPHTEYDPLLGWINKPNVHIQDMYGPDVYLKTNSQRFRSDREFGVDVPDGKHRWICSGDSFTFGYGVDNDHTWCALLAALNPDVETVNMGQGDTDWTRPTCGTCATVCHCSTMC